MKTLARLVSYLFHPILFPTYATLLILAVNPYLYGHFGERLHIVWLIIVFSLTCVFPAVWVIMMRRLQMIDSLELESPKDRIIPFVATATFYLWATWMFKPAQHMKIPSNQMVFYMMSGACFAIFMAFIINIFSKISLHALGAGSLLGLLLTLIRYSSFDLRFVLIGFILLAGIIGAARILLGAHDEREIFVGYFVGFTGQFIAFAIVPRLI